MNEIVFSAIVLVPVICLALFASLVVIALADRFLPAFRWNTKPMIALCAVGLLAVI